MTENADNSSASVLQFLQAIYQDLSGYCYVATRVPTAPKGEGWHQRFFVWPQDRYEISSYIQVQSAQNEVYYAPALFNQPSSKKEHYFGSRVVWCEFDGTVPSDLGKIPPPTLRVRSSAPGHEHWYWLINSALSRDDLERINRGLAYTLQADSSGWDANQVLRPISTYNHKRASSVYLISAENNTVAIGDFKGLPIPPPPISSKGTLGPIPDVTLVLTSKALPSTALDLFNKGVEVGSRSHGLMALGYHCAESGLTRAEIFSVLVDADERWGKFSGRADCEQRLLEIVTIAKTKYPDAESSPVGKGPSIGKLSVFGFNDFLEIEEHIEWLVEGLLHASGYCLIAGPPGVGKSRFALSMGQHMVLSLPFIGRSMLTTKPLRIGFVSLEMNLPELKYFVELQAKEWSEEQLTTLQERFLMIPVGEPIYMNRPEGKRLIESLVYDNQLDGIFIDSMGSATEESLASESDVKNIMDWNDHLRNSMGIFTAWVHHPRKATAENRRPNKLADIYGNQYIIARCSSAVFLWPRNDSVEFLTLKMRSAKMASPLMIYTTPNLHYSTQPSMAIKPKVGLEFSLAPPSTGELASFAANLEAAMNEDKQKQVVTKQQGTKPGPGAVGI